MERAKCNPYTGLITRTPWDLLWSYVTLNPKPGSILWAIIGVRLSYVSLKSEGTYFGLCRASGYVSHLVIDTLRYLELYFEPPKL